MLKPIYNRHSWVLATCIVCGKANYVEPHGTTAMCCLPEETQHDNIPYQHRLGIGGLYVDVTARGHVRERD